MEWITFSNRIKNERKSEQKENLRNENKCGFQKWYKNKNRKNWNSKLKLKQRKSEHKTELITLTSYNKNKEANINKWILEKF